jgi:cytochrome c556
MVRIQLSLLALTLALAGCSSQKEEATPAEPTTIHGYMTQRIDPDADAIWAIGNAAISEDASMDPAKMTDADWVKLREAATRMAGHSRGLETLDPLLVKEPGAKIADEGTEGAPTPDQIQAHLDRDTDVFRALADSLTTHANDLSAAAAKKDFANAGRLINEMDGVCESCHLEFWYPEQKELMKKMGIAPQ